MAEEPVGNTSMRSTSDRGRVLRSKKPKSAALPLTGSARRPLMRTSGEPKIAPRSRTVPAVVDADVLGGLLRGGGKARAGDDHSFRLRRPGVAIAFRGVRVERSEHERE